MTAILGALEEASPGDVLVIDNEGRLDEACVGDLVALRAKVAGVVGIILWVSTATHRNCRKSGCPFSASAQSRPVRFPLHPVQLRSAPCAWELGKLSQAMS
jgi:regulator of RNase E activity RraA